MQSNLTGKSFALFCCAIFILASPGCQKNESAESDSVAKSRPEITLLKPGKESHRTLGGPDDSPSSEKSKAEPAQTPAEPDQGETESDNSIADKTEETLPSLDEELRQDEDVAQSELENSEQEIHTIDIPESWTRLSPKQEIWVDMSQKQVIAGGYICLNAGPLEVFVCPRHTKEHESVVSINATSQQVHAALLAIGAKPGKPVQWVDEYKPATGDVIDVTVMWKNDEELIKRRGQEMILNIKTGKSMQHEWVFGGSIIETVEATDEMPAQTYYLADSGELVCVSNFSTATLDVPVRSSDANAGLLFEANTPKIPDVGTKVYVVFNKKK